MNFKPAKWKVVSSVLVIIIWYFILIIFANSTYCKYKCPPSFNSNDCPKVFVIDLYPEQCNNVCSCPKNDIKDIISDIVIIFFPGILTYIIWSLFEKK